MSIEKEISAMSHFSTLEEARKLQGLVEWNMQSILGYPMNTVKIKHDDPEVWRVWTSIGDVRIAFHKIFPCQDGECFFHPHPWPSTIRCLEGWYRHIVATHSGSVEDIKSLTPESLAAFSQKLVPMETTVSPGDYYAMPDIRHFHQVSTPEINYSMMIMWAPYFTWATRQFSRNAPSKNPSLTDIEKEDVLSVVRRYFKLK
jgi:hypothetical protein